MLIMRYHENLRVALVCIYAAFVCSFSKIPEKALDEYTHCVYDKP